MEMAGTARKRGITYERSRTSEGAGQGHFTTSSKGHNHAVPYQDHQTLKRMEAISPGKWLDDIPAITDSRSPPIPDHRSSVTSEYQPQRQGVATSPDEKPPLHVPTTTDTLQPLVSVLKAAMADSSYSEQASFDTSLVDMAANSTSGEVKFEGPQSPNEGGGRFSFSRASSTGSIPAVSHSSASSAHNTDDEDSDGTIKSTINYKDRRREAHTHAEQKRRDAIKKGYDELQGMVPTCQQQETLGSSKLSKAAILQRSIDYINFLVQQKSKQEEDLDNLRKEVMALKIMKSNYEHIVKAHQNTPQHGQNQVSDEVKFQVFGHMMDSLFKSFNGSVSVTNFAELSGSIFSWLEEYCKPQTLRDLTLNTLRQLPQQQQQQQQQQHQLPH